MARDYGDKKRDLPYVILSEAKNLTQRKSREESHVGTDLQVCPLRTGLKTRPYISFSVSASNQTVIASEAKQSQSLFHPPPRLPCRPSE
jgi:hypothetical protein